MSDLSLNAATLVRVTSGLHERRVGAKVFVLDKESVMHAFENEVAVAIWDLLKGQAGAALSAELIAQEIVKAFKVDAQQASGDVISFLELLLARGLVTYAD